MIRPILLSGFLLPFCALSPAAAGSFEVVASTAEADATLQDYALCPSPEGDGQMMVLNFRRDEFFVAVDLATGKLRQHSFSPGQAWAVTAGPDGKVYFGTSLSPGARLLRYDPATDKVEELAELKGEIILAWLEFSSDGTLYGGAYPSTSLYRYRDGKMENLGEMAPGQTHNVFGAISAQGRIYAGIGMKEETLIEYDIATRKKRNIWPEAWKAIHAPRVYLGVDGLVYAYPGMENDASKGKGLRINADGSVDEVPRREMAKQKIGCYPKSFAAQPLLPDGSKITSVTRDEVVIVPAGGGEPRTVKLAYQRNVKPIFGFGMSPDGKIYGSSKPAVLFSFDTETDRFEDLLPVSPKKAGQVYRKVEIGGRIYMGSYTHAMLHVYDPAKPAERTRTIGPIGAGQDRPVDMVAGKDGLLYIASFPGYGRTDGALTCFDPKTERFENFSNIIPEHSLSAVALSEAAGRAYVGTNNGRGVGTAPLETDAVVGEWDLQNKRLLRTVQPVPGEKAISALSVLPDGTLCGVTGGGHWFGIDAETFTVKFVRPLGGISASIARLVQDEKAGVIYGIAGHTIWKASLGEPSEVSLLDRYPGSGGNVDYGVEIDRKGRLYFANGRDLVRWTP